MILKEIELNGFKSFKDKTKLVFDSDVIAIVGPNGAGKSNIVDALKWLLGEQSTKQIRTTDSSALIFASPNEKDKVDLCSVAVTLEAREQIEDWRPGTYKVEKRYYRDEDAEYLINGEKVRMKDVRNLLAGMGVGLDNLAIVSQGEIGTFLSLVPTDRRVVFEEVAQLGHFKTNKRRILKDIDGTSRNLERLDDNLADRRSRLSELSVQADTAREHGKLSEEYKYCCGNFLALDLIHCDRNRTRHERRIEENTSERHTITRDIADCEKSEKDAESKLDVLREEREKALVAAEEYKRQVDSKRHDLEKTELAIEHKRESILGKQAAIEDKKNRMLELSGEISDAKKRIDDYETKLSETKDEDKRIRELHHRRVEGLRKANEDHTALESNYESVRGELETKSSDHTKAELTLKALRDASSGMERSRDELKDKARELQESLTDYLGEIENLISEIGLTAKRRDEFLYTREALDEKLEQLRNRQSVLLRDESSFSGELSGLERLEREREGLPAGIKAVLDERDASGAFPGVIGVLSELIKVKPDYEFALQAIISGREKFLVTKTKGDAVSVIEWLKQNEAGQVSIIPLDEIESNSSSALPPGLEQEDGFLLRALDAVEFDPGIERAVRYAIGNALVVSNLSVGLEFKRKYHLRMKIANTDGDLIYPAGVLRGGRAKQPSTGLLIRKARIEKLRNDIEVLKVTREENAGDILETDRKLKETGAQISDLEAITTALSGRKAELDGSAKNTGAVLKEIESRLTEIEGRAADDLKRTTELAEKSSRLKNEIENLRNSYIEQKQEITRSRESIDESAEELHREQTKLERFSLIISSHTEEIARLRGEIARREEESSRIDGEISRVESEGREFEILLAEFETKRDSLESEIAALREGFPSVSGKEKEIETVMDSTRQEIESLETRLVELETKLTEVGEDIHKSEVKIASLESERAAYSEKLRIEFPRVFEDLETGKLVAKELGAKGELSEKINELETRLEELGEINQLAITEYDRVKEEIGFKDEQRNDLLESKTELEKNLEEVERKSREVFMEVFNETDKHFDDVFKRLFPHGQASISLTDPNDPLESGIDIRARFPGKKEVDIIQFSGGEKSIVAIALLFAILRVKPASFTFLDEVEAALDDVNVDRFLTLVSDFLPNRQFIIITHNKGTMQFARRLYGITMRKDGVSRVVTVDLKEWDEAVLGERTGRGMSADAPLLKRLPKPKPN